MSQLFKLHIISADGKEFQDEVEMVNLVLTDGAIGILKGHLPLVGIIEISHLSYVKDNKTYYFAVSSGILNVKQDETLVLVDSFESKDEIDLKRAMNAKDKVEKEMHEKKDDPLYDMKKAEIKLKRALNRISLFGDK